MLLTLARVLSRLKGEKYQGSVIAKIDWRQTAATGEKPWQGLQIRRENRNYLLARCTAIKNGFYGQLDVLLFLHHQHKQSPPLQNMPHLPVWHCFTAAEIHRFLLASDDTNTIHQGKAAIVPGILLLQQYLQSFPADALEVRFFHPAHEGDRLYYSAKDNCLFTLFDDKYKILEIRTKGDLLHEN